MPNPPLLIIQNWRSHSFSAYVLSLTVLQISLIAALPQGHPQSLLTTTTTTTECECSWGATTKLSVTQFVPTSTVANYEAGLTGVSQAFQLMTQGFIHIY